MSTTVRLFTHDGLISAAISSYSGQGSENAIFLLKQPYLGNQTITATGTATTSSASLSTNINTKMLRIEVQRDKRVRYEVTTQNANARVASQDSPVLYGEQMIAFGAGYTISLVEDQDA
jgi:hypothetical protein